MDIGPLDPSSVLCRLGGEDSHEQDLCLREDRPEFPDYGGNSQGDFPGGVHPGVVGAKQQDYHFWRCACQLAMVQAPEDVFRPVAPDTEVGRFELAEVLLEEIPRPALRN